MIPRHGVGETLQCLTGSVLALGVDGRQTEAVLRQDGEGPELCGGVCDN